WSSNIGWLSFSGANYGVKLDDITGNLSGFAWSSNIGWLSFEPNDVNVFGLCPDYPNCQAKISFGSGGTMTGWARALSAKAINGWDGMIKFGPGSGAWSGVQADTGTGELSGFAWGDEVVGWIALKGANFGVTFPQIAPSCVPLNFDSSGSSVSPISIQTGGSYTISCDYNQLTNAISVTPSPGSSCSFDSFTGTVAKFNCIAGSSSGTYPVYCKVLSGVTGSNYCSRSGDYAGSITINSVPSTGGLEATLSANPSSGAAPFLTTISVATINGQPDYKVNSYDCDGGTPNFLLPGNGKFSSAPTKIMDCSYSSPGTYIVTVEIEDDDGLTTTPPASVQVNVKKRGIIEI
ncbi:MAG: hypothetical protein AAB491_00025, partial [Patescibacteria group bacterium]